MKTLKVGMLGCGTVGSQVARLMVANKADLTSRAGAELELVKVAVRDTSVKMNLFRLLMRMLNLASQLQVEMH